MESFLLPHASNRHHPRMLPCIYHLHVISYHSLLSNKERSVTFVFCIRRFNDRFWVRMRGPLAQDSTLATMSSIIPQEATTPFQAYNTIDTLEEQHTLTPRQLGTILCTLYQAGPSLNRESCSTNPQTPHMSCRGDPWLCP